MNIGYARCSTEEQDLTVQRNQLVQLGIDPERIYVDHGLTGRNRDRPGLAQALAAVRAGDRLTVTKLDRLGRSVPDLRDILRDLSGAGVEFAIGSSVYDWADPMAKMFLQMLAVVAEFEVGILQQRTREGMAIARAAGKLKGRAPKLGAAQRREVKRMHGSGEYTVSDIAVLFGVSRPTVYRVLDGTVMTTAERARAGR